MSWTYSGEQDPLILCVGARRFKVNPIYSQHTRGGGKGFNNVHKFERYLRHGNTTVATVYGPVVFGNQPCILLRETADQQAPELVAMGSYKDPDTTRVIVKRIVLSGHPFKVHRKTATVRYMFFNAGAYSSSSAEGVLASYPVFRRYQLLQAHPAAHQAWPFRSHSRVLRYPRILQGSLRWADLADGHGLHVTVQKSLPQVVRALAGRCTGHWRCSSGYGRHARVNPGIDMDSCVGGQCRTVCISDMSACGRTTALLWPTHLMRNRARAFGRVVIVHSLFWYQWFLNGTKRSRKAHVP